MVSFSLKSNRLNILSALALLVCFILLSLNANCKIKKDVLIEQTDSNYLANVITELQKKWPDNHSINLVFHGHSVPSGYQKTPIITTFGSYPFLTLKLITEKYPTDVVNVINTSIGGENAEQGVKDLKKKC
jgi:acyl-CoA thioesterase-1